MRGVRAAIRYAKALMQLAQEKGILNEIMADINTINSAIEESHDLELLLQSPLVKSDKKKAILQAVFTGKVSELSLTFINQVAAQNRENILATICEEFVTLYNEINNIAKVSVTTSIPLQAELREELLATLKAKYNLSAIDLDEKVDSSLIGGMVLRMGDKQLDASIRRQLNDIKNELVHA